MQNNYEQQAEGIVKKRGKKKAWRGVVAVMAVGVLLATTYMLLRPAIATNKENAEKMIGMISRGSDDEDALYLVNGQEVDRLTAAEYILDRASDDIDLAGFVREDNVMLEKLVDADNDLWEIVREDEITPGDELRLVVPFDIPRSMVFGSNIRYTLPEQYGVILTAGGEILSYDEDGTETVCGDFITDGEGEYVHIIYREDALKDTLLAILDDCLIEEKLDDKESDELLAMGDKKDTDEDDIFMEDSDNALTEGGDEKGGDGADSPYQNGYAVDESDDENELSEEEGELSETEEDSDDDQAEDRTQSDNDDPVTGETGETEDKTGTEDSNGITAGDDNALTETGDKDRADDSDDIFKTEDSPAEQPYEESGDKAGEETPYEDPATEGSEGIDTLKEETGSEDKSDDISSKEDTVTEDRNDDDDLPKDEPAAGDSKEDANDSASAGIISGGLRMLNAWIADNDIPAVVHARESEPEILLTLRIYSKVMDTESEDYEEELHEITKTRNTMAAALAEELAQSDIREMLLKYAEDTDEYRTEDPEEDTESDGQTDGEEGPEEEGSENEGSGDEENMIPENSTVIAEGSMDADTGKKSAVSYKYYENEKGIGCVAVMINGELAYSYEMPVPESVDIAEYITEWKIERIFDDGSSEEITDDMIMPGDHLRISWKYYLPEEAALSTDIFYKLPEFYGTIESVNDEDNSGKGSMKLSEEGEIKISIDDGLKDEIRQEMLQEETDSLNAKLQKDDDNIYSNAYSTGDSFEDGDENSDEKRSDGNLETPAGNIKSGENESDSDVKPSDEPAADTDGSAGTGKTADTTGDAAETDVDEIEEIKENIGEDAIESAVDDQSSIGSWRLPVAALGNMNVSMRLFDILKLSPVKYALAYSGGGSVNTTVPGASDKKLVIKSAELRTGDVTKWENGREVPNKNGGEKLTPNAEGKYEVTDGEHLLFMVSADLPQGTLNRVNRDITYSLADLGIPIYAGLEGLTMYNYKNEPIGTFDIRQSQGDIVFHFNEKFATDNETMAAEGEFYFVSKAVKSSTNHSEEKIYDLGNNVSFDVLIIEKDNSDISVNKQQVDYNDVTKTITYRVVISTNNGTNGDIKLRDKMYVYDGTGQSLLTGPNDVNRVGEIKNLVVTKYTQSNPNGIVVNPKKDESKKDSDNIYKRTWTFDKLNANEKYILTYTYQAPEELTRTQEGTLLKNKVKASDTKNSSYSEIDHRFDGDGSGIPDLDKWASYHNTYTSFYILINSKQNNLKGYTLSDFLTRMGQDGAYPDPLHTGNGMSDYIEVKEVSGTRGTAKWQKGDKISFDGEITFDNDDYHTYKLYYQVYHSDDLIVDNKLTNTVHLIKGDIDVHDEEIRWIDPGTTGPGLSKTGTIEPLGSDTVTITWTVRIENQIKPNEGVNNDEYWVYHDSMATAGAPQVITDEQIEKLRESVRYVISSSGSSSHDSEIEIIKGEKVTLENGIEGYRNFDIKFLKKMVGSDRSFTYQTTGYIGDGKNNTNFVNRAWAIKEFYAITGEVTYEGDQPTIEKTDGNGNHEASEYNYTSDSLFRQGILSWKITVNIPKRCSYDRLTVYDTLPEYTTFLEDTEYAGAPLYGLSVANNTSMNNAVPFQNYTAVLKDTAFSETVDGRNITITFDPTNFRGERVTFLIRANTKDYFDAGNEKGVFNNEVKLKDKNEFELSFDGQSQTVNHKSQKLTKSHTNLKSVDGSMDTIEYSVDVNPNAEDLLPGGNILTLRDTMETKCENNGFKVTAQLVSGSVKVFEVMTNGSEVPLSTDQYSYNISSYHSDTPDGSGYYFYFNNINFNVPDNKHLRVVYRYLFIGDEKWKDGYNNQKLFVKNSAKLEGIIVENNSTEDSFRMEIEDAGARWDLTGIHLYNIDGTNSSVYLNGAVINIYKWNGSDWVLKDEGLTTGSDGDTGHATIRDLELNVEYKLEETKAPDGYEVVNDPFYFMITSTDTEAHPIVKRSGDRIVGMSYGDVYYFKNYKGTTYITISKEWKNADGTMPGFIEARLGRRVGNPVSGSGANIGKFWSVHIEKRDGNGNLKSYQGFASVADGSKLTFNVGGFKNTSWASMPVLTINGMNEEIESLYGTTGQQLIPYTITVTGDTNIIIKECWQYTDFPIDATVQSSIGSLNISENGTDTTDGSVVGKEDDVFAAGHLYTLNKDNNWTQKVDNLEKVYVKDGVAYEWLYFVKEVNNIYYTSTYSANNNPGISSGELVITNTRNDIQSYVLPKTGGMGTTPFAAGGSVMAGLGACGILTTITSHRRRRNRRGSHGSKEHETVE